MYIELLLFPLRCVRLTPVGSLILEQRDAFVLLARVHRVEEALGQVRVDERHVGGEAGRAVEAVGVRRRDQYLVAGATRLDYGSSVLARQVEVADGQVDRAARLLSGRCLEHASRHLFVNAHVRLAYLHQRID